MSVISILISRFFFTGHQSIMWTSLRCPWQSDTKKNAKGNILCTRFGLENKNQLPRYGALLHRGGGNKSFSRVHCEWGIFIYTSQTCTAPKEATKTMSRYVQLV